MKRFYASVAVEAQEGGHALLLDGKPVKTPAGRPLRAPTSALAEAVAAEWAGQGTRIEPGTMPLTQLLNTALDRLADPALRAATAAEIAAYAETDLVCFHAIEPPELAMRQAAAWQPVRAWLAERHGAALAVSRDLRVPDHPPGALERIAAVVAGADNYRLAGLAVATGALGSVVLGLALADGHLTAEAAWRAAVLDDLYQIEKWGEDQEARQRLDALRGDVDAAERFLRRL